MDEQREPDVRGTAGATAEPRPVVSVHAHARALLPDVVVVPLDDGPASHRILPLAQHLSARLRLPIHRVTVSGAQAVPTPAGHQAHEAAMGLLQGRPSGTAPAGPIGATPTADPRSVDPSPVGVVHGGRDVDVVLRGERTAEVLLAYLANRGRPLLTIASRAHAGLQRRLQGSITYELVAAARGPVVALGPSAPDALVDPVPATLLVAGERPLSTPECAAIAAWALALDADVEVVRARAGDQDDVGRDLRRTLARIAAFGVATSGRVLPGVGSVGALLDHAEQLEGPVMLVVPDAGGDGHASADRVQALLQRSPWPVLARLTTGR